MKHLYIDYSYICHRSVHGIARDIKQLGYGILRHTILKSIFSFTRKYQPDKVFICCDTDTSWRKKFYEAYKGQRKAQRDKSSIDWNKFYEIMGKLKNEMREYFPFIVVDVKHMEADDIVGILVTRDPEIEKIMVTADADYYQLMQYPNVKMYDYFKKKEVSLTRAEAEHALQMKILTGDKSDNIAAVRPRLGEKTAEKMIESGELDLLLAGDEDFRKRYDENKKIIDLTATPKKLVERMDKHLENYEMSNGGLILEYFKDNRLKVFLHDISEIRKFLNNLVEKKLMVNESDDVEVEGNNKFEKWAKQKGL